MTGLDDFVRDTVPRHIASDVALYNGDPEPRIAMWSVEAPVTLFSAGGECLIGSSDIFAFFRSLATRYSSATGVSFDLQAAEVSDGLAYTVGFERFTASREASAMSSIVIRATQVYRREGTEWKVVHRHGDPGTPRTS